MMANGNGDVPESVRAALDQMQADSDKALADMEAVNVEMLDAFASRKETGIAGTRPKGREPEAGDGEPLG